MSNTLRDSEFEFSFFDLLEEIKKKYYIVIITTIIGFLLGFLFYSYQSKSYQVNIKLDLVERSKFIELDNAYSFMNTLSSFKGHSDTEYFISREDLRDSFVENFLSYNEIINVLKEMNIGKELSYETLIKMAKVYKIEEKFYEIIFISKIDDLERHLEIIDMSFDRINKYILDSLISSIENKVNWVNSIKQRKINDLEIKIVEREDKFFFDMQEKIYNLEMTIDQRESKYYSELESKKIYLEEQISIAKSINLANGISAALISNEKQLNNFSNLYFDAPQYYRGYKALEIELENLNNRVPESINIYDSLYIDYMFQLERLKLEMEDGKTFPELSNEIERLKLEIQSNDYEIVTSNIRNISNFEAAGVDSRQYELTNLFQSLIKVLIISFILSIFVSCTYIIISSGYKNYKSK